MLDRKLCHKFFIFWHDLGLIAADMLGGGETISHLSQPLQRLSSTVAGGGQFDWQAAEAALYCIRYVLCTKVSAQCIAWKILHSHMYTIQSFLLALDMSCAPV